MTATPATHPEARPVDAVAAAIVVVLCLSWGLNQVAIKLTLVDIPPMIQATIRSVGALLCICLWCAARGVPLLQRDGSLRDGLITGALFGFEFVLIYRGLHFSLASRASLFIYVAPFLVAFGGTFFLPGEKMRLEQWLGMALSFVGIAVALGVPQAAASPRMFLGDLMLIAGGATWAATTLMIKGSRLRFVPPEKTLAYQLLVSIPILAASAWMFGEHITAAPRPAALGWLGYQTVWVVAITYGVWFGLVKRYSASRLSAFTFLAPLFGVIAAHVILGDPIEWPFALAAVLVVAGLILVNRPR